MLGGFNVLRVYDRGLIRRTFSIYWVTVLWIVTITDFTSKALACLFVPQCTMRWDILIPLQINWALSIDRLSLRIIVPITWLARDALKSGLIPCFTVFCQFCRRWLVVGRAFSIDRLAAYFIVSEVRPACNTLTCCAVPCPAILYFF
jgi:hypothetical protein